MGAVCPALTVTVAVHGVTSPLPVSAWKLTLWLPGVSATHAPYSFAGCPSIETVGLWLPLPSVVTRRNPSCVNGASTRVVSSARTVTVWLSPWLLAVEQFGLHRRTLTLVGAANPCA